MVETTTITVAEIMPSEWRGRTVIINGARYVVTEATSTTLTIRERSPLDRIKSVFHYWKTKLIFFYWDVVLEIEENWEEFKEWRSAIRTR
jgi:hypothetical protein